MQNRATVAWLFLFPSLLLISAFTLYPVIYSFTLSFQDFQFLTLTGTWIGFENYRRLFDDPMLGRAFVNGLLWFVGNLIPQIILGVGFALILNMKFRGRGIVRTLVILPYFLPGISMFLTWRWMYYDVNGIINHVLQSVGLIDDRILWINSTNLAMMSVVVVGVWRYTPFVVLNCLARLSSIDSTLYEAAKVDGASVFQRFIYITLPQLRSVILIVVLLRGIFTFNKFEEINVITEGGPLGSTTTLPVLSYERAFGALEVGEGSAINTLIFLILSVVAVLYLLNLKPAKELDE